MGNKREILTSQISVEGVTLESLPMTSSSFGAIDAMTTTVRFRVPPDANWVRFSSNADFVMTWGLGGATDMITAIPPVAPAPAEDGADQNFELNPGLRRIPDDAHEIGSNSIFVRGITAGLVVLTWYK